MSEKEIESVMRGFKEAIEKSDVEKALSYFAEDAVYAAPEGAFKGKEELKRYLTWSAQNVSNPTIRDTGVGIMVKGDKAVYEHSIGGIIEGNKYETLAICVYEFSNGKIHGIRSVYDRLSVGKQVATGWFEKRIVNTMVERAERGLR